MSAQVNYRVVTPRFNLLKRNPLTKAASKRLELSAMFGKAGDITQLGIERATVSFHVKPVVSSRYVAYLRPAMWGFGQCVAMRVTFEAPRKLAPNDEQIAAIQNALLPKAEMSRGDMEEICDKVAVEEFSTGRVNLRHETLLAFIRQEKEMNRKIETVARELAGADTMTRAGEVELELENLDDMDVGDLQVLQQEAKDSDQAAYKAATELLGYEVYKADKGLGMIYSPFAEAIQKAQVQADLLRISAEFDVWDFDIVKEGAVSVEVVLPHEVTNRNMLAKMKMVEVSEFDEARSAINFGVDGVDTGHANAYQIDSSVPHPHGAAGDADFVAPIADLDAIDEEDFSHVPDPDADWIEACMDGGLNSCDYDALDSIGTWRTVVQSCITDHERAAMAEYALGASQVSTIDVVDAESKFLADFCGSRAYSFRKGFYLGSSEIATTKDTLRGYLPIDAEERNIETLSEGFLGPLSIVLTMHSFLKSGHTITANAIGHTFIKMYQAVKEEGSTTLMYSPDELASVLGSVFYPAIHFADKRLVAIVFRRMYSKGELSFAIGRRLTPLGPGVVAQFLLAKVLDALDQAGFFRYTGRGSQYAAFQSAYGNYMLTAHLETPYAKYLYGESRTESLGFKNYASAYLPYAAALDSIMPGSSYRFSVALKRDADAAMSNSIVANLEVAAFVQAYKTFITQLIRNALSKKVREGVAAGDILALT